MTLPMFSSLLNVGVVLVVSHARAHYVNLEDLGRHLGSPGSGPPSRATDLAGPNIVGLTTTRRLRDANLLLQQPVRMLSQEVFAVIL